MPSAGDLLLNNQDTNNSIDFSLKKPVQYHARKELCGILAYLLDEVVVDDILSHPWELKWPEALSDKILLKDISGITHCWQVYAPFQSVLHRQTIHDSVTEERAWAVMVSFSNVWNLDICALYY